MNFELILKRFWLVVLVICVFVAVPAVSAEEQFLTFYSVNYDVGSDGVTTVNEEITFKNTTDKFYASKYSVSIGATKIFDIQALDKKGLLPTNVTTEGNRTKIEVSFTDQIVGVDKEYKWNLSYKSNDYAERQGKVWQVTIPRAPKLLNGDSFSLNLSVPVGFGDPTSIDPAPSKKVESGGKIRMFYDKSQLDQRGILASFGSSQVMDFDINYTMRNSGVLPVYGKLPLPMDTNFQQVLINELDPKPENVLIDDDGNYIAWYKLERDQVLNVRAKGLVKLSLKSSSLPKKELSKFEVNQLIKNDQYWDVDNPMVKEKVAEVLKDAKNASVREKARLINRFVVNYLKYDHSRVKKEDFKRLGALSALNNPEMALCGEYADLFVTMVRAAGIPARRLEGYAYTSNKDIRPLSLGGTLLHAWAEYFDPIKGWVMVDPTWESANDGVDYFSNFDLNHFVLSIVGYNSIDPSASGKVEVSVSDALFKPVQKISLGINGPSEVLSGLPAEMSFKLTNLGNMATDQSVLVVRTNIGELDQSQFEVGVLPPYGYFEAKSRLLPGNLFVSLNGEIEASGSGVSAKKDIKLKPFYEYTAIFGLVVSSFVLMIGVYALSLYLHIKSQKVSKVKQEKKDVTEIYKQEKSI